ncbi:hypothetical protein BHE74_00034202 [Ensete ventricosum]|nr:hypothetical protein BHE74_00034202 [Ensete ventricosum]RZR77855.1 hypothetical protein BHM03_00003063 [Ensete ventricosum]
MRAVSSRPDSRSMATSRRICRTCASRLFRSSFIRAVAIFASVLLKEDTETPKPKDEKRHTRSRKRSPDLAKKKREESTKEDAEPFRGVEAAAEDGGCARSHQLPDRSNGRRFGLRSHFDCGSNSRRRWSERVREKERAEWGRRAAFFEGAELQR